MIDHLGISIRDFEKSARFYESVAPALGLEVVARGNNWIMIGKRDDIVGATPGGSGQFWFGMDGKKPTTPIHIAFRVDRREQVDAFYALALSNGGQDNGAPGLRAQYHATYYAAFVTDPDGHNIEAVCHHP